MIHMIIDTGHSIEIYYRGESTPLILKCSDACIRSEVACGIASAARSAGHPVVTGGHIEEPQTHNNETVA